MKIKTTLFLLISFLLMVFISCQKEINQVIVTNQNESLQLNTAATELIQRVVENDGTADDIVDKAPCISIKLPVTVIANGVEIVINSVSDYTLIQANYDQFDDHELEIKYPITIILNDYSEVVVNNHDELEHYAEKCINDLNYSDEIRCLDFIYPITLSVYDSNNQFAETVNISNDEDFYKYIQQLNLESIVAINFPISVHLYTGETKIINNLTDLEALINSIKDSCN